MEGKRNVLVTPENLKKALSDIGKHDYLSLDTETFGLEWGDKAFSYQVAVDETTVYYFNLLEYPKDDDAHVMDVSFLPRLIEAFGDATVFMHNAKYDMARLYFEGYEVKRETRIHCTQAIERLINNQLHGYGLDACLKRRGRSKNDGVMDWLKKNKAYTYREIPGKKKRMRDYRFDKVPFSIMFPYGCDDARDTLFLGMDQLEKIKNLNYWNLYSRECSLTKIFFDMEKVGVKIDPEKTREGLNNELRKIKETRAEIEEITGRIYEGGPTWLQKVFDENGVKYRRKPDTGNPIFDSDALGAIDHPVAEKVLELRTHEKYAGTYYSSFLYFADENNRIHANIWQGGTETGRLSYSDPNLQNIPKEDEDGYEQYVRGCFVPEKDYCLVMIDYDQQEFRLMLDYANEQSVINAINGGEDVHTSTANMVGVIRKAAKTLNFMLLYGGGAAKLAAALGVSIGEAKEKKYKYFSRLPNVKKLIDGIIHKAKMRGWVKTWKGRILRTPQVKGYDFSYKMPNHLIQGGCADVTKDAMIEVVERVLDGLKSRIIMQVHDELIFEVHKDELHIVPELKKLMEDVYPSKNGLKLTCGVEYSWKSWAHPDRKEGYPCN